MEFNDDYNDQSYLTFYSYAGNEAFSIEKIDEINRDDPDYNIKRGGGSNALVIIFIVIAVINLIICGIVIFFKIKNKHVSSYDIEKI